MHANSRRLIVVDDDLQSVRHVFRLFSGRLHVHHASSPTEAMKLTDIHPQVLAVLTEQVLSCGSGLDLLESVRTHRPEIRRVLLTTYTDLSSIVSGLHSGAIQALVQKPTDDAELLGAVCPETLARISKLRKASA